MGKAKQKLPYIPLYIGDWEQDTNTISLEAEGALLKLIFKLWKSDTKGTMFITMPQLSILLKKSEAVVTTILEELQQNNVLNIEFTEISGQQKGSKIESRRMLKEARTSKARKEAGKKGAEQSNKNVSANDQQIPDIDNDINNNKKSLLEIFFADLPGSSNFETIASSLLVPKDQLRGFIPEFMKRAEVSYPNFDRFCNHFKNWVAIELRKQSAPLQTIKRNPLIK